MALRHLPILQFVRNVFKRTYITYLLSDCVSCLSFAPFHPFLFFPLTATMLTPVFGLACRFISFCLPLMLALYTPNLPWHLHKKPNSSQPLSLDRSLIVQVDMQAASSQVVAAKLFCILVAGETRAYVMCKLTSPTVSCHCDVFLRQWMVCSGPRAQAGCQAGGGRDSSLKAAC